MQVPTELKAFKNYHIYEWLKEILKKAPVKPRSGEKRTGGKSSKPRSFNHQ